jgi:hypothetical protein
MRQVALFEKLNVLLEKLKKFLVGGVIIITLVEGDVNKVIQK